MLGVSPSSFCENLEIHYEDGWAIQYKTSSTIPSSRDVKPGEMLYWDGPSEFLLVQPCYNQNVGEFPFFYGAQDQTQVLLSYLVAQFVWFRENELLVEGLKFDTFWCDFLRISFKILPCYAVPGFPLFPGQFCHIGSQDDLSSLGQSQVSKQLWRKARTKASPVWGRGGKQAVVFVSFLKCEKNSMYTFLEPLLS